eukprot:SAG22_NODE_220_length_14862_cov_73.769424_3_plen_864_part_00
MLAGMLALTVLGACTFVLGAAAGQFSDAGYHTCIIGAGPGGLQLGHHLNTKGRNYAIFERAERPGIFFEKYPIHRQLISVNKRNTGRDNPHFNLRHDWNSLVGNDEPVPLTKRTKERFPHADLLVQYLREFAAAQERSGRIFYKTNVDAVHRDASSGTFTVLVQETGTAGLQSVSCQVVVSAAGMWVPNVQKVNGIELAVGYEELPPTGEIFEDKAVAVLGLGNAGFETANAAENFAKYVHMWPTRVYKWPFASWESRYDGNLRAIRTNILDGYLLKSLDLLPLANQIVIQPDRVTMHRCYGDKICMFLKPGNRHPQVQRDGDIAMIGIHVPEDEKQVKLIEQIEATGVKLFRQGISAGGSRITAIDGTKITHEATQARVQMIACAVTDITEKTVEPMMAFRNETGETFGRPYEMVVRATGWHHNTSIYSKDNSPALQSNGKFARMTHEYESVNVPGLYFAGSLAHGKDRGRGVGGVIKGFRHTATALFHVLEAKYHAEPWPTTTFSMPEQADALLEHAMTRVGEAPDLYNMVYTLVDGIFFDKGDDGKWSARYCEGMPWEYINSEYGDKHRMVVMMGFDGQRRSLETTIQMGIGFEPFLWYWAPNPTTKGAKLHKEVLRLSELPHLDWSGGIYGRIWNEWGRRIIGQITSDQNLITPSRGPAGDYNMRVMELDMVIINDLGVDVQLQRQRYADRTRMPDEQAAAWASSVPEDVISYEMVANKDYHTGMETTHDVTSGGGTAQKVVTRDGEVWRATYTDPETNRQAHLNVDVDFRWGIFQEVWLSEVKAGGGHASGYKVGTPARDRKFVSTNKQENATLTREEIELMKVKEIKELLKAKGLDSKGKKATLVDRLCDAAASKTT